jgi:hypothetical protein
VTANSPPRLARMAMLNMQTTAHTEPGDAKRPKCGTDSFGSHRLMEHVTRTGSR